MRLVFFQTSNRVKKNTATPFVKDNQRKTQRIRTPITLIRLGLRLRTELSLSSAKPQPITKQTGIFTNVCNKLVLYSYLLKTNAKKEQAREFVTLEVECGAGANRNRERTRKWREAEAEVLETQVEGAIVGSAQQTGVHGKAIKYSTRLAAHLQTGVEKAASEVGGDDTSPLAPCLGPSGALVSALHPSFRFPR